MLPLLSAGENLAVLPLRLASSPRQREAHKDICSDIPICTQGTQRMGILLICLYTYRKQGSLSSTMGLQLPMSRL